MMQFAQRLGVKISVIVIYVLLCIAALACGILTYAAYALELYDTTWDVVFAYGEVWLLTLFDQRYTVIVGLVGSIVLVILTVAFLMSVVGHRAGRERVERNALDRIPLEILIIGIGMLMCVIAVIFFEEVRINGSIAVVLVFGSLCYIAEVLLALAFLLTMATRYKTHTIWRNTLLYRVMYFFRRLFFCIPIIWRGALIMLGLGMGNIFLSVIFYREPGVGLILLVIELLILFCFGVFTLYQMQRLEKAGEEISSGNLQYRIETEHMYPSLRRHGENLNNINQGISRAVEQKMKSERFKTELITNVSHDIKTPLTSIVNYVDLLKKENLEDETAREYIEVLDRQSARLKKLTEDLVEASKASTGNIIVNAAPTEVGMMLEQAVGEYDERLRASEVEPVLSRPEEGIYILADGKLLWRILDNLMSNVCKYAMPGTRFYLTLEAETADVHVILRNISKYPLNISSEELLSRFVRGDSSRSTEGSGLGLSIAQSLTQLQKGSLELSVDGDLFKIVLSFPRMYI